MPALKYVVKMKYSASVDTDAGGGTSRISATRPSTIGPVEAIRSDVSRIRRGVLGATSGTIKSHTHSQGTPV